MKKIIFSLLCLPILNSCTEVLYVKKTSIYNLDDKVVSVQLYERPLDLIRLPDSFFRKMPDSVFNKTLDSLCDCYVIVKLTHDSFRKDFIKKNDAINFVNSFNLKNNIIINDSIPIIVNK